ncbi:MAG: hypothetical protein FVQ81_07440 [Candidatus Glassbacteria bacterium]|nr:hypothetical protein [Candidatus Glassbacteria bacterium]
MKLLTVIISSDLTDEVGELISAMDVDCYVRIGESYGISHRCKGSLGDNMPWEAAVLLVAGEEELLVELADNIRAAVQSKDYEPCLRMMLSPVDRVWMH